MYLSIVGNEGKYRLLQAVLFMIIWTLAYMTIRYFKHGELIPDLTVYLVFMAGLIVTVMIRPYPKFLFKIEIDNDILTGPSRQGLRHKRISIDLSKAFEFKQVFRGLPFEAYMVFQDEARILISTSFLSPGDLDALKTRIEELHNLLLALAELGEDGYRTAIEHQANLGDMMRERLDTAGWRVVNDTPLPGICFTGPAIESGRVSTADVVSAVQARGVWISEVRLSGHEPMLRACITSFRAESEDVDALIDALKEFEVDS